MNNNKTMRNDFAIFILSHSRADNVDTIKALNKSNYTGKYYIIIDVDDPEHDKYYELYDKDIIISFDKKKVKYKTDTYENTDRMNAVVFARNECFDIAKKLGLKYFLELDDDYVRFEYRYENETKDKLMTALIEDFNSVCEEMINFLDISKALSVAFSQGGDFIGGVGSRVFKLKMVRKVMNSFFCCVDRPFKFSGLINEDVNTYVTLGSRGNLFLTYSPTSLIQKQTQSNPGGLTDIYLSLGTYQKSFYSVIAAPSCVSVNMMGDTHQRMHHLVDWERGVPKIISDRFKIKE